MDFLTRNVIKLILKVSFLSFIQVLLVCFPALAFAQLPTINLTVGDVDASEVGPNPGSFIINRSGGIIPQELAVKVDVTGTAAAGYDYSTNPGMQRISGSVYRIIIPPEQTDLTVQITPVQDGNNEGDETVIFTLVADSAYTVGGDATAQLAIGDDSPLVNVTVDDGGIGESGPNPGSFIINRSGGIISQELVVKVDVTGTATAGNDYSTNPGMQRISGSIYRIIIPPDQTDLTVLITPVRDGNNEGDETVIFTLVADSAYTVGGDASAQLTIADDSPLVSVTVNDGDIGESGTNPGSFIISRNGGVISHELVVNVEVTGTATAGNDYSTNPGMQRISGAVYRIIIPPDQAELMVFIMPVHDGIIEEDETVVFTLATHGTYTLGEAVTASMSIADFVGGVFKDSFESP